MTFRVRSGAVTARRRKRVWLLLLAAVFTTICGPYWIPERPNRIADRGSLPQASAITLTDVIRPVNDALVPKAVSWKRLEATPPASGHSVAASDGRAADFANAAAVQFFVTSGSEHWPPTGGAADAGLFDSRAVMAPVPVPSERPGATRTPTFVKTIEGDVIPLPRLAPPYRAMAVQARDRRTADTSSPVVVEETFAPTLADDVAAATAPPSLVVPGRVSAVQPTEATRATPLPPGRTNSPPVWTTLLKSADDGRVAELPAASLRPAAVATVVIAGTGDTVLHPLAFDTGKDATFAQARLIDTAVQYASIDQQDGAAARNKDELAAYPFLQRPEWLPFGHTVAMPLGYYDLCTRSSDACQPSRGWAALWSYEWGVHLDGAHAKELVAVNASVNRRIRQTTDRALYHVADRWVVNPGAGDCEDFALTKKALLIAKGWPSSALLVALATTRAGVDHAVLIARTDSGDLVLDSLRSGILEWTPTLYHWISVQSPTNVWKWVAIGHAPIFAAAGHTPSAIEQRPTATVVFE